MLIQAMETFTLIGVLVATVIFARLALKAKSVGSFRFQLSIFILIWSAAEIPHTAETLGIIGEESLDVYGFAFHMASMFAFAIFVGARTLSFMRAQRLPSLPKPVKPALPRGAMDS